MSGSVNASARFSGGGASASAQMASSLRQSEVQSSLLVHKKVVTVEYFLRDGAWIDGANELAESDPKKFIQKFGDTVIDSVRVGGRMAILYTFTFGSREEAQSFNGNFSGSYGTGSGSVSYQRSVFKLAQNSTMNASGFVLGASQAPELQLVDVKIDRRGRIIKPDPNLEKILDFYNKFEAKVGEAESQEPVELNVIKSSVLRNAVPVLDLAPYQRLLSEGIEVTDDIDKRASELEYLKRVAVDWNEHINSNDIEAVEKKLDALEDQLVNDLDGLRSVTNDATLSVSTDDVPALPKEAWLTRLKSHRTHRDKVSSKQSATRSRDYDLPTMTQKRPSKVSMNYALSKGTGEIVVQVLDRSGSPVQDVWKQTLIGPAKLQDKKHLTNTHFVLLDPESAFVRITNTVNGGTLSTGGIIFV
jgi:FlaG/FlaF family flagellin (archaellin)